VTLALVEAVRGIRYGEIPREARETAHHCLLDFLGVTLAGSQEPLTEILVGEIVRSEGGKEAGIIGRRARDRLTAALVNGAAGHALDFDDTHATMTGHPSGPVLSALLALAETEGADGRALLAALVAGVELECRIGALLGGGHYAAGFHTTGTVGTFGAAAACAHLLGLDQAGWLHALGLAGARLPVSSRPSGPWRSRFTLGAPHRPVSLRPARSGGFTASRRSSSAPGSSWRPTRGRRHRPRFSRATRVAS
jgi:2-methylcitrate dehydratase PrpD